MTLTAAQLKTLLEQQLAGCHGQSGDRFLQPSNGFRYSWRPAATACSRIVDVTFTPTDLGVTPPVATGPTQVIVKDGVVQDPARTYRVTVNNFMAAGGDGNATLVAGTDRIGGAQDIDAFVQYMTRYLAPRPPLDPRGPAMGEPRIVRVP